MSSIIKKIGTLRLDKGQNVNDVIHYGYPLNVKVFKSNSTDGYDAYDLFVEEGEPKQKKTTKEKAE